MKTVEVFLEMTALGKPATSKDFLHWLELQQKGEINQGSYNKCNSGSN